MPPSAYHVIRLACIILAAVTLASAWSRRRRRAGASLSPRLTGAAFTADLLCLPFSFLGAYLVGTLLAAVAGRWLASQAWPFQLAISLAVALAGAWCLAWGYQRLLSHRVVAWFAQDQARSIPMQTDW